MNEHNDNSPERSASDAASMEPSEVRPAVSPQGFSSQELRDLSAEISDQLPDRPERETSIVLMDIDPSHVYVYWHVRDKDMAAALHKLTRNESQVSMVLRLHDALCSVMTGFVPWPPMERTVTGLDGHEYLEIPEPGKTLIAELVLLGKEGAFTTLASTRPVRLPPPGRVSSEPSEPVELVLVDEPGNPPQVLEVISETQRQSHDTNPTAAPAAGQPPVDKQSISGTPPLRAFTLPFWDAVRESSPASNSQPSSYGNRHRSGVGRMSGVGAGEHD